MHGALAGSFLGLAFTGLPIRFHAYPWIQSLVRATGGFGALLFFHKFCALVLTVTFLIHLANIGYQLRRNLVWNPEKERFVDDDEANKLLDHALRDPWKL